MRADKKDDIGTETVKKAKPQRKQYTMLRRVLRQYKYSNIYETMIFLQKELFNLTP